MTGDLATQSGVPSAFEIERQAAIRAEQQRRQQQLEARQRYQQMPKIGPAKQRSAAEQRQADQYRMQRNQQYAAQNPEVTVNEFGDIIPSGYGRFIQTYGNNLDKFVNSWETPLALESAVSLAPLVQRGLSKAVSMLPSMRRPGSTRMSQLVETVDPETGISSFVKPAVTKPTAPAYGRDAQGMYREVGGKRNYFLDPPADEINIADNAANSFVDPVMLTEQQYNNLANVYRSSQASNLPEGGFQVLQRLRDKGYTTAPVLTGRNNLISSIENNTSYNDYLSGAVRNYIEGINTESNAFRELQPYLTNPWDRLRAQLGIRNDNIIQRGVQKAGRVLDQLDQRAGKLFYKPAEQTVQDVSAQLPALEQQVNELLQKGVGVKKNNLPLSMKLQQEGPGAITAKTEIDGKTVGRISLVQNQPGPKRFSELIMGMSGKNAWQNTPGFRKIGDFPFTTFNNLGDNVKLSDLYSQGISGEYNKALNEILKRNNLGNILSGGTGHSSEGLNRWQNLVKKGLAKNFGDEFFMLKKQGGPIIDPRGQWAHPGKVTRIPSEDITMEGVPYPVLAKASNGMTQMMMPGQQYSFPGAEYVDEYPVKLNLPKLAGNKRGLFLEPQLYNDQGRPAIGATMGYTTPRVSVSGSYLYGQPNVGVRMSFQNGGLTKYQALGPVKKKKTLILAESPTEGDADNAFLKEAATMKGYLNKYFPDEEVEIVPAYKESFRQGLKKSDPNTRLVFLAHHGSNLFGIPSSEAIESISKTPYENCYGGTCYGSDLRGVGAMADIEDERKPIKYKGVSRAPESYNLRNFYTRTDHVPWLGFAPVERGGEEGFRDSFFRRTYSPKLANLYKRVNEGNISIEQAERIWDQINAIEKKETKIVNLPKASNYGKYNAVPYPARTVNNNSFLLKLPPPPPPETGIIVERDGGEFKEGGQYGGLDRWFAEKWVDIKTGKPCGRQKGEDRSYPACRPSRRVNYRTPKTTKEMSPGEKARFKDVKQSSQRIPYNHKRR